MKIKDMPTCSQPRERMLQYGVENLSDTDLLSILLRTGTKNENVQEVASNIISSIGNLNNIKNVGIRELSKIKGVGIVKAQIIIAAIELGKRSLSKNIQINMSLNSSETIHSVFKQLFLGINQEKILAIYLDTKKRLISYKIVFIGTLDKSIIHPREIFNEAIKLSASSIVIIHNHPSNDINPSIEDINITKKIKETGEIIGIPLLDHLITNGKDYYSFYDKYYKE